MRGLLRGWAAVAVVSPWVLAAAGTTAADLAKALRENRFDRDECYRVRDVTLVKEDIRLYLNEGHLIFSKPVAGRRIAAVFTADVEGGDCEIMILPPDRAERRSLANFIEAPNLDDHFQTALLLFTGDDYDRIKAQFADNPANKRTPELGALMDEQWTPVLRNLSESYVTRLTLDLMGGPSRHGGLLTAMISSQKLGTFDVAYDPEATEQVLAGKVNTRDNQSYFDVWTSFRSKSARRNPKVEPPDVTLSDYRIQATVNPDLSMDAITRVKVRASAEGTVAAGFDISQQMEVTQATVDGKPAEVLQRDTFRLNLARGGNNFFLVVPPEPLHVGRDYEFEFHHSGKVIRDAGDRVFYVIARGSWYPTHRLGFTAYDLTFRYPKDLEIVTPGDVVDDRTDGDWRITRRRTTEAIRIAAFNLGNYAHARLERGPYAVDVYANRSLEKALQPRIPAPAPPPVGIRPRRTAETLGDTQPVMPPLDPLARLKVLASEVASALEFMAARFGPPALPHLTVSPIPATFGQGFPGLIYLSTLAYLKNLPPRNLGNGEPSDVFFQDILQAHETAHQWWGNRVCVGSYRDYWLMEALANYSALLYLEKSKGLRVAEQMLDSYRAALLAKGDNGQPVDSTGPIVLGTRLENSQEPRAWRAITYGKGTWILQMLRRRLGDERFFSLLAEVVKRYNHREITTEQFRELAAGYLPPKSDDPKLESFFEQWVYGTGIPAVKLAWSVKGQAPALRLVGTVTQSEVDEDFSTQVPVEIQVAKGRIITQWVRTTNTPVTFTVPLSAAPVKVVLDTHHGLLKR